MTQATAGTQLLSTTTTGHDRWMDTVGIPIHRGYFIDDLRTLELGWWDERECQAAFLEMGALQCGYCTAGILMTLVDFLANNPTPEESELKNALSGNLCRCTGYQNIFSAAKDGAERLRIEEHSDDGIHR